MERRALFRGAMNWAASGSLAPTTVASRKCDVVDAVTGYS